MNAVSRASIFSANTADNRERRSRILEITVHTLGGTYDYSHDRDKGGEGDCAARRVRFAWKVAS